MNLNLENIENNFKIKVDETTNNIEINILEGGEFSREINLTFESNKIEIDKGEEVVFNWSSENANEVLLDNIKVQKTGSKSLIINETKEITLTAFNADFFETKTIKIEVKEVIIDNAQIPTTLSEGVIHVENGEDYKFKRNTKSFQKNENGGYEGIAKNIAKFDYKNGIKELLVQEKAISVFQNFIQDFEGVGTNNKIKEVDNDLIINNNEVYVYSPSYKIIKTPPFFETEIRQEVKNKHLYMFVKPNLNDTNDFILELENESGCVTNFSEEFDNTRTYAIKNTNGWWRIGIRNLKYIETGYDNVFLKLKFKARKDDLVQNVNIIDVDDEDILFDINSRFEKLTTTRTQDADEVYIENNNMLPKGRYAIIGESPKFDFIKKINVDNGEVVNGDLLLQNENIPVGRKKGKLYSFDGDDYTVIRNSKATEKTRFFGVKEIDNDIPKFDWSNGKQELLVEKQATNYISDNTNYSKIPLLNDKNLTKITYPINSNQINFRENDNVGLQSVLISTNNDANKKTCFSGYIKKDSVDVFYISGSPDFQTISQYKIDLLNETMININAINDFELEKLNDGWFKFKAVFESNDSVILLSLFDNPIDFAKQGDSTKNVFLAGLQAEDGNESTNLIHTNGTIKTRTGDIIERNGIQLKAGRYETI